MGAAAGAAASMGQKVGGSSGLKPFKEGADILFGQEAETGGTVRQQLNMSPAQRRELERQQQRIQQQTGQFTGLLGNLQQQALGSAPTLGAVTPFTAATSLDPMSQALVAQGQQGMLQQAGRQQADIAQQFAGNPGVMRALQAQAGARSALNQNPLMFQAAQQQSGRQIQEAGARMAAEQAANQALLQQQAAQAGARGEAASFGQAGLGAEQNVLGNLQNLAQLLGTQVTTKDIEHGRTGGLLGK